MSFQWPEFLWLLLALPLFILIYVWLLKRKKRTAIRYASLALVKEAMVGWAGKVVARRAVDELPELIRRRIEEGPEAAAKWLKEPLNDHSARDLGTRVHLLVEKYGQKDSPLMSDEERPYMEQYATFLNQFQPEIIRAEAMVCSLEHGYAGTGDLWARFPKYGVGLVDVKTGSGYYPDTALQLAGLKYAEFMGWPNDPKRYPIPESDFCAVLWLRPDGFELVPYDVTEETFEAFLHCLRMWEWLQGPAQRVVGQPLAVPTEEETSWAA
jgi:hypothetical protein